MCACFAPKLFYEHDVFLSMIYILNMTLYIHIYNLCSYLIYAFYMYQYLYVIYSCICYIMYRIIYTKIYNYIPTWEQILLPFIQNGSWGCRVLLLLVILKGRTNELTKILIVFNLEVLLTAWDERNPCAVSRRKRKTVVNDRAGIKTLSLGQEFWS